MSFFSDGYATSAIGVLLSSLGGTSGTFTQGSTADAVTNAALVEKRRQRIQGEADLETTVWIIDASEITSNPSPRATWVTTSPARTYEVDTAEELEGAYWALTCERRIQPGVA